MKSAAKYAWNSEKKLNIKQARKPQEGYSLSGVVLVVDNGTGYSYVKFDESTVKALGQVMPYGIGPEDSAYIKVVRMPNHYDVWCCYSDKSKSVKLWKSKSLPDWIQSVKFPTE